MVLIDIGVGEVGQSVENQCKHSMLVSTLNAFLFVETWRAKPTSFDNENKED